MATDRKLSFGTAWINSFKKSKYGEELSHCDDVANGFGTVMERGGHTWAINHKQDEARPADWTDRNPLRKRPTTTKICPDSGDDAKEGRGVDTVDFAMIVSHGGDWGVEPDYGPIITVGFNQIPGRFCNFKTRFGNTKLKWLVLDSCHSLQTDSTAKRKNPDLIWRHSFDGLHTIFGFNDECSDSWWTSDRGSCFAARIVMWDSELADSWIDCAYSHFTDDNPGAAAAGRDKQDAETRLDTETLSSSFDSIPNKEVKVILWRFRESGGSESSKAGKG
jgi:hypothetical protein